MPTDSWTTIESLAGVAFHYARPPVAPYGSRGKPYSFRCRESVKRAAMGAIEELSEWCPWGKPEVITSAGAFVDKPGQHSRGLAIDVDAIFWKERSFVTNQYALDPTLYLAIEAVFRRHFGLCLNYLYNKAHHDHLHLDLSTPVGYRTSSRSATLFLQASLVHIHGQSVIIDGVWGSQTSAAAAAALESLGLAGKITAARTWKSYLERSGRVGLERRAAPADSTPAKAAAVASAIEHLDVEGEQWRQLRGAYDELAASPELSRLLDERLPYDEFRLQVARQILEFEARRDAKGNLKVYKLPKGDGGGSYEVAGINDRYHPEMASRLRDLIEKKKDPARAEAEAIQYIATCTDSASRWCGRRSTEAFLRDCIWNRGPTGAARILQLALGFKGSQVDGLVGPKTLAAVQNAEKEPIRLLEALRAAREQYERKFAKRDESSPFWKGLARRWGKAADYAGSFA